MKASRNKKKCSYNTDYIPKYSIVQKSQAKPHVIISCWEKWKTGAVIV